MPFADLDAAGIVRALAQIAEKPSDFADVFFERREEIALPPDGDSPGLRCRRETGLAVRLLRDDRCWLASRDAVDRDSLRDALRHVSRARPRAAYPEPAITAGPWSEPPTAPELLELPSRIHRALRAHRASFPVRLEVRRHRRWSRVVGTELASAVERESYYSLAAELPSGRCGALVASLDDDFAERFVGTLLHVHAGQEAPSPEPWDGPIVLGPDAAAVLLHEAVAHALEADVLALAGAVEATVDTSMGAPLLDIFDDPRSGPEGVRRQTDDEGFPCYRRCLLRAGVVEQPLSDVAWARRHDVLTAGAGRRGSRHEAPAPRSTHLILAAGSFDRDELFADAEGGLYLPAAERGHLDGRTGRFQLRFAHAQVIEGGAPGRFVGACAMQGRVAELLAAVVGVGSDIVHAGAGWCAKGGVRLPVWATTPAIRLEGVRIEP